MADFHALNDIVHYGFTNLAARLHWSVLLSLTLLSLVAWLLLRNVNHPWRDRGFFSFLFARDVWLHPSAKLDYRFVAFDKAILGLLVVGAGALLASLSTVAAEEVADIGDYILAETLAADPEVLIGYTIALLVADDFCRYWTHRWMHTNPVLWHFHKVHHSPEVLVPISQMRHHPVNHAINLARKTVSTAAVTGAFVWLFPGDLNVVTIAGVNAGRMAFYLSGGNLRHSHVWLSFGRFWSHILISPAMHQIHHSKLPRHIDRNYGSQFAVWDWMFGSLYVPRAYERLELGIDEDSTRRMRTIKGLYVEPVKDAWREWRARKHPGPQEA
ncbi:sterol desaturase family protein [Leptolyngbya sp. 15MV]|nr:sterol desaturase family protein [Leptolyngbya sp. 15MV]